MLDSKTSGLVRCGRTTRRSAIRFTSVAFVAPSGGELVSAPFFVSHWIVVLCVETASHAARQNTARSEPFGQTGIVTKTTGQRALKELLEAGLIQRIGKGCKGNPLRYFLENVPGAGTARDPEVSVRSRMRMDFTHKTLMAQSFGSARQKTRIRN